MKEQEQINEIGNIIQKKANGINFDDASDCAVAIYRANYRKIPNKILANKVYSDTTLKSWTKQDLIEHIRILENNWTCAEETLNNQTKNFEVLLKNIYIEAKEMMELYKNENGLDLFITWYKARFNIKEE